MIRFTCPQCRSVLTADVRFVGQGVKCSQCKQILRVPEPPVAAVAPSPIPSRRKIASVGKVAACLFLVLLGFFIGRLTGPSSSSNSGPLTTLPDRSNEPSTALQRGYDKDELKRMVGGKSRDEVLKLLGEPYEVSPGIGYTTRIQSYEEYGRELQSKAFEGDRRYPYRRGSYSPTGEGEEWIYKGIVRNRTGDSAKLDFRIMFHQDEACFFGGTE